jgi:hypothetical protein
MMHKINIKPADKANKQIVPNMPTVNLSSAQKCQLTSTGAAQTESKSISSKNSKIPQQEDRSACSIKSLTGITIKVVGSHENTQQQERKELKINMYLFDEVFFFCFEILGQ